MQTIRKDSFPEETVNRIKGILADKLNLSVQESHLCKAETDNYKIFYKEELV